MSPNSLVQSLSHQDIELAAGEALKWRRTGVLKGDALRHIAERLVAETGVAAEEAIRMADTLIIEEAAARYVARVYP